MLKIDELKVLLALHDNVHIPHLESEIFADSVLIMVYLDSIGLKTDYCRSCILRHRQSIAIAMDDDYPYIAYCYARDVIKGRWPEAEGFIASDPGNAYRYARFVMKCRWVEAEAVIANTSWASDYNEEFGTNI
jgi:hypothetical protein